MDDIANQLALSVPVAAAIYGAAATHMKAILKLGGSLIEALNRLAAAMEAQNGRGNGSDKKEAG